MFPSSSPSSSSPSSMLPHDVFLSFRGKDTREGFTSFLHHALLKKGIISFMDTQLEKGKSIDQLFGDIEKSMMAVIIFSENYASSKWCLKELVKIFECERRMGQVVLPIFYNVSPSDLKNQTKGTRTAEHLAQHMAKYGEKSEDVQNWRDAISVLGNLVGWRYTAGHGKTEREFIQEIAEGILEKLKAKKSANTRLSHMELGNQQALTRSSAYKASSSIPKMTNTVQNHDLLMKRISENIGFSGDSPSAAALIFNCLLQWGSFEVSKTNVFDRIIKSIRAAVKVSEKSDIMSYWLSNICTLILHLEGTLKPNQGLQGSSQSADDTRYIEAKYPALLFKENLANLLEEIYNMIINNLKKEISQPLDSCSKAPTTWRESLLNGTNGVTQTKYSHWESILTSLNNYLQTLRANYVTPFLVCKVYAQVFAYINVQLFNSVLSRESRREYCSLSNGMYLKDGLAKLENWCFYRRAPKEEFLSFAWDELKHIRQAVVFLITPDKPKKSLCEITNDMCPVLSIHQLYQISTMYYDDLYNIHHSASAEVLQTMMIMCRDNPTGTFQLHEEVSSNQIDLEEFFKLAQPIEISKFDLPPLLFEELGFSFLPQ